MFVASHRHSSFLLFVLMMLIDAGSQHQASKPQQPHPSAMSRSTRNYIHHQWSRMSKQQLDKTDQELFLIVVLTSLLQTRLHRFPLDYYRFETIGAFLKAARLTPSAVGADELRAVYQKYEKSFETFETSGGLKKKRQQFYSQRIDVPHQLWPHFRAGMNGRGCAEAQHGGGRGSGYCQYGFVMDRCWHAYYTGLCYRCLETGQARIPAEFRDARRAEFLVTVWPRWRALKKWIAAHGHPLHKVFEYRGGEYVPELAMQRFTTMKKKGTSGQSHWSMLPLVAFGLGMAGGVAQHLFNDGANKSSIMMMAPNSTRLGAISTRKGATATAAAAAAITEKAVTPKSPWLVYGIWALALVLATVIIGIVAWQLYRRYRDDKKQTRGRPKDGDDDDKGDEGGKKSSSTSSKTTRSLSLSDSDGTSKGQAKASRSSTSSSSATDQKKKKKLKKQKASAKKRPKTV